jgi:enoyl-CoA hydratase/carnithine racemase
MTSRVRSERLAAVALITFDNAPAGVMTAGGARDFLGAVDEALANEDVRAIVITGGQPGVFIRHYDVGSLVKAADAVREGAIPIESFLDAPFARATDLCAEAAKPVIAAINGTCMGGGFELALACDIRVAGREVREIGLPEIRLDIFPGGGGTQRLPRLIGQGRALSFILQGQVVEAAEALRIGLVDELAADPLTRALEIADRLASRCPAALATIKALTRGALDAPVVQGLAEERLAFARLLRDHGEPGESMRAFLAGDVGLEARP